MNPACNVIRYYPVLQQDVYKLLKNLNIPNFFQYNNITVKTYKNTATLPDEQTILKIFLRKYAKAGLTSTRLDSKNVSVLQQLPKAKHSTKIPLANQTSAFPLKPITRLKVQNIYSLHPIYLYTHYINLLCFPKRQSYRSNECKSLAWIQTL